MRGLTTTIALVLVLAGLGAYIYFVDSGRPAAGVEEKDKVFSVEAEKINEITVTTEGETTVLQRADGNWKITTPFTADADRTEASTLATGLAGLELGRVVDENASDLAQYGLAEPRIRLAYKAEGGGGGEVLIGDKTATGSDLYALVPGQPRVFLIQSWQETSLAKKPFDLRDKRILQFDRDNVDSVEIARAGEPTIVLARNGSDWTLKEPVAARADYSTVEGLLTKLASANMTKLVDASGPQTYGLEVPGAVIRVGAGSSRAAIEFGAEEDGTVYARDPSRQMIFTVDSQLAADARRPASEYRNKSLFQFRPFTVARLRLTRGSDTYEFQKVSGEGGDKWQRVTDGAAIDVDTAAMEDLLTRLAGMQAQSFNPTTNAAGADPALVVAASYDGDKFERVRIITGNAGDPFGVREDEAGVFVLDRSAFEEALKGLDTVLAPPAPPATPGS